MQRSMQVCRFIVLVLYIVLIVLVSVDLSDARGRGGGSRGGSKSGSKSRSGSKNRGSGSSGKSKITKYTPIKASTVRSPVIVRQTKLGSRSSTFKKVVVGYLVYRYVFSTAPVYRHGYPMYRNYVAIPKNRAMRLSFEEEKLMDSQGNLCLGKSSENRQLREDIDGDLVELNTTVKYSGNTVKLHGIDNTVDLEDIKGQDFEVTSNARYNTSIVDGTNCTQLEKRVEGTMVEMYETNPDSACAVYINCKPLLASIVLIAFIHHT